MRPSYAYLGIGLIFILAAIAFVNPSFMSSRYSKDSSATKDTAAATSTMAFTLTSSAFKAGTMLPTQYTCDVDAPKSPPLTISGKPEGAKTYVLIVEDPDVPKQLKPDGVFLHWLVFNIPAGITDIVEGGTVGTNGANGAGKAAYAGPCPPAEYQPNTHRYVFTLYALDIELSLEAGASKDAIMKVMQGHILGTAQLIGNYKRN